MISDDIKQSWEKFLNPETLRENLVVASLFISAFEMVKQRILEKPQTFFTNTCNQSGPIIDDAYKAEVLSLHKSPLTASLLWLQKLGAIEQNDIDVFDSIRLHRNELTHELMSFLSDVKRNLDVIKFEELVNFLAKVEKWWFINFELAIDPDMLPEDTNVDEVVPGPIWGLQLMLDIALGNESERGYYYKEFSAFINRNRE